MLWSQPMRGSGWILTTNQRPSVCLKPKVHYPHRVWGHALNKDNKERRLDSRLETRDNILIILGKYDFDVLRLKTLFTSDSKPRVNEGPLIKSCSEMSLTNMEQHQVKWIQQRIKFNLHFPKDSRVKQSLPNEAWRFQSFHVLFNSAQDKLCFQHFSEVIWSGFWLSHYSDCYIVSFMMIIAR